MKILMIANLCVQSGEISGRCTNNKVLMTTGISSKGNCCGNDRNLPQSTHKNINNIYSV